MPDYEPPLLHIYSHRAPHGLVHIVGTERGLVRLARAILEALERGTHLSGTVYAQDELGYEIHVERVERDQMDDFVAPYAQEEGRQQPGIMWPRRDQDAMP